MAEKPGFHQVFKKAMGIKYSHGHQHIDAKFVQRHSPAQIVQKRIKEKKKEFENQKG
jgi:hypothetical protein